MKSLLLGKSLLANEISYPILGKYHNSNLIVLFTDKDEGVVLVADEDWKVIGDCNEDWEMSEFTFDKDLEVLLSNKG